ncbi:epoxide hydrolase 3 isoform X1 [Monodelphis domestica]|uniref:Epoxide hydrolase 3 n=1 Tax=Monodelphis domestica TaxID=13616 RepID=A0A5F8GSD4_MONDO|nr:epoxide hydrolase 3 isoform X1 [Monodelphis domestica]
MPNILVSTLLLPCRWSLRLLRFFMWILVYWGACLAAVVYSGKALGHVLSQPHRGCCGRPRTKIPSYLIDPSFGQHCFMSLKTSGLRLHYVIRGHGPLMLCLHGFPQNWFSWRYQLLEFGEAFCVVAVDMRGYGISDSPTSLKSYTIDALTIDIKDIIEGLGYSTCVLVAHDWGGLLAWNFSIYYPSMVQQLVIVSAAPMSVYQEYVMQHPSQLLRSGYVFLFQLPWLPEKLLSLSDFKILKETMIHPVTGIPGLTEEELETFLYSFSQIHGLTGPLNYYRNLFTHFPLERQQLTVPTLLLWGEKDQYLEPGLVASISKHFVSDHLQFHILPDAGHWIPQGQPAQMHNYMWSFLRRFKD